MVKFTSSFINFVRTGIYQRLLRTHPIPTKSVTSAIVAGLGSNIAQVENRIEYGE